MAGGAIGCALWAAAAAGPDALPLPLAIFGSILGAAGILAGLAGLTFVHREAAPRLAPASLAATMLGLILCAAPPVAALGQLLAPAGLTALGVVVLRAARLDRWARLLLLLMGAAALAMMLAGVMFGAAGRDYPPALERYVFPFVILYFLAGWIALGWQLLKLGGRAAPAAPGSAPARKAAPTPPAPGPAPRKSRRRRRRR